MLLKTRKEAQFTKKEISAEDPEKNEESMNK
jgi:hypothetical protein